VALGKKSKLRKSNESACQTACVALFRLFHPTQAKLLCAFDGNARNAIAGHRKKLSGYQKGFPDVLIAVPNGKFHGLFIEFKAAGEKPRAEQLEIHTLLVKQGYQVLVIDSVDSFKVAIESYFGQ
jgi:hypothetical protein